MNRAPHEPLTAEERALADRLARLGPHDGPSPELDARILSAAHSADASRAGARRKRRWLGLTGGSGGLVTGLGLAASLTIALGVVWQMRPMDSTVPIPRSEADGDAMVVEHLPRRGSRLQEVPPPPAEPTAMPVPARALPPPAAPAPAVAPGREASPPAASPADDAARSARQAAASEVAARQAIREAEADRLQAAERAQQAPAAQAKALASPAEASPAVAEEVSPAVRGTPRPSYTRSARAAPEPAMRPVEDATADAATASPADAAPVAAGPLPAVQEDKGLAPEAWLERIRQRRDLGQVEDARASLQAFRQAHPRVELPADLQALDDATTP